MSQQRYDQDLEPLDYDRFEYVETHEFGSSDPIIMRVGCKHRPDALEPVRAVSGEVVATLCLDCDAQLPAGYR